MLTILSTHPIQYQVPLWQALARDGRVPFEVCYLSDHGIRIGHDREFGKAFAWDIDLISGYPHRFLTVGGNSTPGSFWKCRLHESFIARLQSRTIKALWIQGWQVAAYWQALWAARRLGVEVWLRGESNDLAPTRLWRRALKRLMLGHLFERVDRFLYIGTANKRLYQKFNVPEARLHPAPYAVDNERFARQAEQIRNQKSEIRKQWGISDHAFCILFCGKFVPKKRPMDLVRAVQSLIGDGRLSPFHLLFVGSGELGNKLRAVSDVRFDAESSEGGCSPVPPGRSQTRDLRRPPSETRPPASFAGFLNQTEISRAYVAADCLVLPSDHGETWGLVINEAIASGLPCIVSDACGCAIDVVTHCGPALPFKLGNLEELRARLTAMSKYPAARHAAQEFLRRHSLAATVEQVADLYAKLQQHSK
jgi:glycosyltransferase involved in cell wall biosynthesis